MTSCCLAVKVKTLNSYVNFTRCFQFGLSFSRAFSQRELTQAAELGVTGRAFSETPKHGNLYNSCGWGENVGLPLYYYCHWRASVFFISHVRGQQKEVPTYQSEKCVACCCLCFHAGHHTSVAVLRHSTNVQTVNCSWGLCVSISKIHKAVNLFYRCTVSSVRHLFLNHCMKLVTGLICLQARVAQTAKTKAFFHYDVNLWLG